MQHRSTIFELSCAPIPTVRIGLVGAGQRGRATLSRYAYVDGAEFCVVVDPDPTAVASALELLREQRRPLPETSTNAEAWRELCRREDIDLIYICTDWSNHATMAVEAMRCGKHVAVEVPAATTVADCWELVRTAEATQRHCFMTENCCYDWFALATLDMHRRGVFGTITHCEGAYLHDWSALFAGDNAAAAFYRAGCRHGGNPYPTHAIGPIAQLLGFHRGDRMVRLSSVTGMAAGRDSLLGHANHTLITTERGVTILLQFDGTTPRPYSRIQGISGTKAFAQKYPLPLFQDADGLREGEAAENFLHSVADSPAYRLWREGAARGVPNAMNYAMDCRLIHCLRHGLPLDIDVYDAAEWSCLAELTRLSAQRGGAPVDVPDFLNGEMPPAQR